MKEVNAKARQQTPSRQSGSKAVSKELQEQLHRAISALQKGLVERDTEVGMQPFLLFCTSHCLLACLLAYMFSAASKMPKNLHPMTMHRCGYYCWLLWPASIFFSLVLQEQPRVS